MVGIRKPTTIGKIKRWHCMLADEFLQRVRQDLALIRHLLSDFIEVQHLASSQITGLEDADGGVPRRFHNPLEITDLASIYEVA